MTYGGRPYGLLSESEGFRSRAVLAIACAKMDGSPVVILDGAEVLDRDGRNGLIGAIKASGKMALLGMMFMASADVPDLAKAGLGESYWIENGVAKPL